MKEMKQFRDDIGRSPDDGETLMNGDDVGQTATFIKRDHPRRGPVVRMADGTPIGTPDPD